MKIWCAFACAMGLLGACFGATSAWFQAALHRAGAALAQIKMQALIPLAASFAAEHAAVLLAMVALLLVVPTAVYLTLLRE